jgi:alkyldihydroxyacetonephosphate synthase
MFFQDFFCDLGFLIDSLEPSVSWERCVPLINAIKESWKKEMEKRKLVNGLAFRISQIYGSGACLYFYYGIGPTGDKDQYEVYEELTNILRQTIQEAGGSISHHHGVGKKNMRWYQQAVSKVGVDVYKSIKSKIDPNNVFDAGNMIVIESVSSKL